MAVATAARTRYVTLSDAAECLSVTERTVRNYIARGELTGYRIGARAIRIDQRELDGLLKPIPTVGTAGGAR